MYPPKALTDPVVVPVYNGELWIDVAVHAKALQLRLMIANSRLKEIRSLEPETNE